MTSRPKDESSRMREFFTDDCLLPLLLVLICFCSSFVLSSAFTPQHQSQYHPHGSTHLPSINRRSHIGLGKPSKRRHKGVVSAIVYGPDGKIMAEEKHAAETLNFSTYDSLMEQLNDSSVLLTRLACAFAPPPHDHLLPNQVVTVSLERVGSKHIDLAVAVPTGIVGSGRSGSSGEQLAQILVPVEFPEPVNSHDQKDGAHLIVRQMQQLEGIALERLTQREKDNCDEQSQSSAAIAKEIVQQLTQAPKAADWPKWWTSSQQTITVQEEYKSVLNEAQFEESLISLCQRKYREQPILEAKVALIGTAGVFLRALVEKGTNGVDIVDIPIPFPPGESTTADAVRENVISLIESINMLPVEDTTESTDLDQVDATPIPSSDGFPDTNASEATKEEVQVLLNDSATVSAHHGGVQQKSTDATRRQPISSEVETRLAAKFAAIEDIGERAFEILKYLRMI